MLFGSIVAVLAGQHRQRLRAHVPAYAVLRFIAGVGLAGELGAGITLVSEILAEASARLGHDGRRDRGHHRRRRRRPGRRQVRVAHRLLRRRRPGPRAAAPPGRRRRVVAVQKSHASSAVAAATSSALFRTWPRAKKYLSVIAVGVPIWFAVGILVTFSPELGRALGLTPAPEAGNAVLFAYSGWPWETSPAGPSARSSRAAAACSSSSSAARSSPSWPTSQWAASPSPPSTGCASPWASPPATGRCS